jgi:hypothetical protein
VKDDEICTNTLAMEKKERENVRNIQGIELARMVGYCID